MTFSSAHMTFGTSDMSHTNTQLMTSGIPPYEPYKHTLFMVSGSMLWKRKNVVLIQFSIFLACACMLNMADDTRKRTEAARLMREVAKLLEELNKQSTGRINERNMSEELQKLFAPYRQMLTNNRQALQEAKPPKAKGQRSKFIYRVTRPGHVLIIKAIQLQFKPPYLNVVIQYFYPNCIQG